MTPEQPQEQKLPRFTVREAQMAEFLADAGNMLQTLQAAEQRMRDQRALLEQAADRLQQQCDRVDETTERFTNAINNVDKATRDRFMQAVVEMTRRALEQATAEIRAAGQAELQRLMQGRPVVDARLESPNSAEGAAAAAATTSAAIPVAGAQSATARASYAATAGIEPLQRPLPLWRRYPLVNLVISAALLSVAYLLAP